jgi:PAS domain S-box-containing protein
VKPDTQPPLEASPPPPVQPGAGKGPAEPARSHLHGRLSLQERLTLLVVISLLPLSALAIWFAVGEMRAATRLTQSQLKFAASLIAAQQDLIVESAEHLLGAISAMPVMRSAQRKGCERYFEQLHGRYPMYANIGLADLQGKVVCHANASSGDFSVADRPYFNQAVAERRFVMGATVFGKSTARWVIPFAQPVFDGARVSGAVFATLDLAVAGAALAGAELPTGARVAVADRRGAVLMEHPPDPEGPGQRRVLVPAILAAAQQMTPGSGEWDDRSGERRIYAFVPSHLLGGEGFLAWVSMDRAQVTDAALASLRFELLAMAMALVASGLAAWWIGGRVIVKPAQQIVSTVRQLEQGRLAARVPLQAGSRRGEFARIASAFNLMAESLQLRQLDLEAELGRSRSAYAILDLVLNSMDEALVAVTRAGQILMFNEAAASLFPLDGPALLPQQWAQHLGFYRADGVTPYLTDDLPMVRSAQGESGRHEQLVVRNARVPGGRLLQCSWQPIHGEAGIRGGLVVFTDVTELQRLQAEQAAQFDELRETQRKLVETQRIGRVGNWEMDLRSERLWWSDEVYVLFGLTRDQFDLSLGGFLQRVHSDDRDRLAQVREAALNSGDVVNVEFRVVKPDGTIGWLQEIAEVRRNERNEPIWFGGVVQDITERKQAEADLELLRKAVARVNDIVLITEADPIDAPGPRIVFVNEAFERLTGYTAQEAIGNTPQMLQGPKTDRAALARIRAALLQGQPVREELINYAKDGREFWLDLDIIPMADEKGGFSHLIAVERDITSRKQAERALMDSERELHGYTEMLQRATEAAQAITAHASVEGALREVAAEARRVIGAHQAMVSLTPGQDRSQWLSSLSLSEKYDAGNGYQGQLDASGLTALELEPGQTLRLTQAELEAHPRWRGLGQRPDTHPPLRGLLAVPLVGGDGENIGSLKLSDKNEGDFTQRDQYVALQLAQLASVAIENGRLFAQIRDLNASLEARIADRTAQLARQSQLYRTLAEQAPEVVWHTDAQGRATFLNRAYYDLVGGGGDDGLGNGWLKRVHPDDVEGVRRKWLQSRETFEPYMGIRRILAKDGSYHTMSYKAAPVLDENGQVAFWVGIDADITELKAIEAALRSSNRDLEAFSYSISHELRAPIGAIGGFSHALALKLEGHPEPRVVHYLARIEAGVLKMEQFIEALLSLAKLVRAPLRYETVDLSAIAREILEGLQVQQSERQASVRVQDNLVVQGDARLLRLVMENLLGNAWKFTSRQDAALIEVGKLEDGTAFFVRDNGVGFDMAYAGRLFGAFQRLHTEAEFPGTGIGLATVARIMERHQGMVWGESQPGEGACFFFTVSESAPPPWLAGASPV